MIVGPELVQVVVVSPGSGLVKGRDGEARSSLVAVCNRDCCGVRHCDFDDCSSTDESISQNIANAFRTNIHARVFPVCFSGTI
jgi:hypothetical protein